MLDLTNRLQWRHLRLLHAIGQVRQLSAAAERMAISQPAASRMLAEIEAMTDQPLFERTPNGLLPRPIGEILIVHAGVLIRGLATAVNEVSTFDQGRTGAVRIGAVTGAAVAHVVPAVQALMIEAPEAEVHVDVGPSDMLIAGLLNGDFDFVLSRIPEGNDSRVMDVKPGKVEIVKFMMRDDHPLLGQTNYRLCDLAGYNWVVQAPGTPMRQAVQEAFIANGINLPPQIVNTSSLLVMIAYLQSSNFITPVSSEVSELFKSTGSGGLQTIQTTESIIVSPYHLIRRKNFEQIPVAQRFGEILEEKLGTSS